MADKAITDLEAASAINGADLFVLQQGDAAKKASGQLLENWLLSMANGHGGIQSIVKTGSTGTNPVVDTYTIEFSDSSTTTFTVTNGKKGAKGDTGAAASVTSSSVQYVESASGTTVPSSGWQDNPPTVAQGNYLWTKVVITFSDGTPVTSYSVARNGVDGSGTVSTVCGVSPDGSGNVALTASDVGALPTSYQAPVTTVNGNTGAVVLSADDVGAVASQHVSKTISSVGWYRVFLYSSTNDYELAGSKSANIRITITREGIVDNSFRNEVHFIDFSLAYGSYIFSNETSVTQSLAIDKIRYGYDLTNHFGFIDIHCKRNESNPITVSFNVVTDLETQRKMASVEPYSVADAPSGETVLSTYKLNANTEGVTDGWHYTLQGKHIRATKTITDTLTNYTTINGFFGYYISNITTPFTMASAKYYVGTTWSIGGGFSISAGILSQTATKFNAYALATASGSQDLELAIVIEGEIA